MRITEVTPLVVAADAPRHVRDAVNSAVRLTFAVVLLDTDEGIRGTGFSTTLGTGAEEIRDIVARHYAPVLLDRDPRDSQQLWEEMYWAPTHWVGRVGITQMALAAVDVALWDIRAQAAGMPLWQLVGGHKDGTVPAYNSDGGWLNLPVQTLISDMARLCDQGYVGVKMKIGLPDPREDLKRVAAVREALGDEVWLAVDVNQGWTTTQAVTWAPRLEEFHLAWIEEPLDPDDVEGHARLAGATRIPIALGEHLYARTAFRDYIARRIVGYVQPDVTRLGGVTEWLAVAEMAHAAHIPVVPHAGDLMRVHQHLGAGHASTPMIECIPWLQELFAEEPDIRDGSFHVPNTPGASTTFTDAALTQHRVG